VPGLIEGAHKGAGLGDRFLRHLERTRALIHLLEVSTTPGRTPLSDYLALRKELESYDPAMAARQEIVVLNKIDLPDVRKKLPNLRKTFERRGLHLLALSAVTGEGVPEVLEAAWKTISATRGTP
jgi:GTPase